VYTTLLRGHTHVSLPLALSRLQPAFSSVARISTFEGTRCGTKRAILKSPTGLRKDQRPEVGRPQSREAPFGEAASRDRTGNLHLGKVALFSR
jgi:hypothetical protein